VLLSGIGELESNDSVNAVLNTDSRNILSQYPNETKTVKKDKEQNISVTEPLPQLNENTHLNKDFSNNSEYKDWIQKVTRIYSAMEPRKSAKIIQTYSDNVARDILYNMNKKTAAKVVSEFSPETANRIFRFE
jgi:flagellar motility protein MotE (MotC chaperone)